MKILLTTLNAKFVHSSLALGYLKAYCKDDFPQIEIKEYTINDQLSHIVGEIYKKKADVVAFSCYIWNLSESLLIAESLKKVSPETLILFGGPEVSYDPKAIMLDNPFIDFIIYGEGEETLKELLLHLYERKTLSGIQGLVHRLEEKIIVEAPRPLIKDLDQIPSPYEGELLELKNRIAYLESSRGCPFQCQYCLSSTIEGVRFFSLERTKKELHKLIEAGVTQVKFVDRTFNCNKKRTLELFEFLVETVQGKDINFHFEIAADLMNEEILEYLGKAPRGLFQFEIGVQSTNLKTLELIQRKMDFDKVGKVVENLRAKNNIHLHLDLIAGLPEENYSSFKKSFNDVYLLGPHKLQLGFLKLLKGSGVRQREKEYNYLYLDQPPYEVLANKDISFEEMLELKMIEELVDKYLNSYRFGYSLPYVIDYFETPFDFYYHFAQFWEKQGYFSMAHNQVSLYEFLGEFFKEINPLKFDLFKDILKLDYLLQGRLRGLPEYFAKASTDSKKDEKASKERLYAFLKDEEKVAAYLPDLKDLYPKQLGKILQVETFEFNLEALLKGKGYQALKKEKISLVFNYHNRDKIFQRAEVFALQN